MTAEEVLSEILLTDDAYISWSQTVVDGQWVEREDSTFIIDGHIRLTPEAKAWIKAFYEAQSDD